MHPFDSGDNSAAPSLMRLEIQGATGEAVGTYDLYRVREMIYSGRLKGREYVREPGSDWEPLYERPDLQEIFDLVGVDLVKIRLATQRIQGWRRDDSANEKSSFRKSKKRRSQEIKPIQILREDTKSKGIDSGVWKMMALAILVFVILMWKVL